MNTVCHIASPSPKVAAAPVIEDLVDHAARRLDVLCRAVGFNGPAVSRATSTLRRLMQPWGARPLGQSSGWVSDIADDHSPIELSLAITAGEPEVRMMIEAQGAGPSVEDQRRAALALTEALAAEPGVDLTRFRRVARLFLPEQIVGGKFALWHSFCFSPEHAPTFKAYFNTRARGPEVAAAIVEQALGELGFGGAWPLLSRVAAARGPIHDELKYFALDLSAGPAARAKVYFLHHGATPADLDSACRTAKSHDSADTMAFTRAMVGDAPALSARPPYTCHSFFEGEPERPQETNLYIPACAYAQDDRVLSDRVVRFMGARGLDAGIYQRALSAFAHRPLDAGIGMHSYVASSLRNGARRITVYLSPELVCVHPPGSIPAAPISQPVVPASLVGTNARPSGAPCFRDSAVNLPLLSQRAHGMRWASFPADVIPLTAAEPDFEVAVQIRDAVKEYVDGGLLGHAPAEGLPELRSAAADMLALRRGLHGGPEQIFATDGVASALHLVARFALQPGDEAIVFDPVDFLFREAVEAAGGRVRHCPVDPASGTIDLDALEGLVTRRTRLIAVCNPLNPVGRVLTREELLTLGRFAVEHGLWLIADEVWSDIVYPPHRHLSVATLGPEIAARTFTLMGTSKSFGCSGIRAGFIHAPDAGKVFALAQLSGARSTAFGVSTLSQVAAAAAFSQGYPWVEAFLQHLERMRERVVDSLNAIDGVTCRRPEGTYVAFPDVRRLGLGSTELADYLLREARVAVVPGAPRWFGPGAEGHIRICFATSEGILTEALERIQRALRRLNPS